MFSFCLSLLLATAQPATDGGVVAIKGHRLLAEVARTDRERDRALAFRQQFKSERCMFVACAQERPHPIQTRKFLLPFDLVWVDAAGLVVETQERVPPCKSGQDCPKFGGKKSSRYYLFLAAGMVRRLNVKEGDKIVWDLQFTDGTTLRNGDPIPADGTSGRPQSKNKRRGKRSGR